MTKQYKLDMTSGPLFIQIGQYMIPLALSFLAQLIFHIADIWVIGRYADHTSVAAIGTTSTSIGLLINTFTGLSVGANAVVAQCLGARDGKNTMRAIHTSMGTAIISGIAVMLLGMIFSRSMLELIDVPGEIMPKALLYLRICFIGAPFLLLYNFGCAVMRAIGDTKRPLYFLFFAGIVNVLLNLVLVINFNMDVAGVAIATIISQLISALLVVRSLTCNRGISRLYLKYIRIDPAILRRILHIGIPSGIQSACFSASNLIIQGAINSFGPHAIAANTIVANVEYCLYSCCYAAFQTSVSFAGQNFGAKKYHRIAKSFWICSLYSFVATTVLGCIAYLNGKALIGFFLKNSVAETLPWAMIRMKILFITYGLVGVLDSIAGILRGVGKSIFPMIMTILGACVFRIWWAKEIFPQYRTMENLMISYPVSWILVSVCNGMVLWLFLREKRNSQRFFSTGKNIIKP